MIRNNVLAAKIAFVSGFLLIITGTSGFSAWKRVEDFITANIMDNWITATTFSVVLIMATLGGLSVIVGSFFFFKNKVFIGRVLISLGSGAGLIGMFVSFIMAFAENSLSFGWFFSFASIALLLALSSQLIARNSPLI